MYAIVENGSKQYKAEVGSIVRFEKLSANVGDKVELEVTETTPPIKVASANATKDAIVETGLLVKVPLFIEQGEKILVTTADGKYSSRA